MNKKIMKLWVLTMIASGGLVSSLNAAFVTLQNPSISPKPLESLENGGVGIVSFGLVETSDRSAPAKDIFGEANIRISVELNKLALQNNDVTEISGEMMDYFSASYNVNENRIVFTQTSIFPNFGSTGVTIPVEVTANALATDNSLNGFNANISANDEETSADGNAAEFTFTQKSIARPDHDGDNVPDDQDIDDDNDGILDTVEMATATNNGDTDDDGIADHLDTDSDNDGISDNFEAQDTAHYIMPSGRVNNDGLDDRYGSGLIPINTDGTDSLDFQDIDSDNDGILDKIEGTVDTDYDGESNYRDLDSDADGLLDSQEGEADSNGNMIPDYLEKPDVVVPPVVVPPSSNFNAADDTLDVTHYGENIGYLASNDSMAGSYALWELEDLPSHGEVEINPASGQYSYFPEANYNGNDSFTYRLRNSQGQTDTAMVSIDITCSSSQTSDNVDSASLLSMLFSVFLTAMAGLYFMRKEERGEV